MEPKGYITSLKSQTHLCRVQRESIRPRRYSPSGGVDSLSRGIPAQRMFHAPRIVRWLGRIATALGSSFDDSPLPGGTTRVAPT
jgi:hypothetical protein